MVMIAQGRKFCVCKQCGMFMLASTSRVFETLKYVVVAFSFATRHYPFRSHIVGAGFNTLVVLYQILWMAFNFNTGNCCFNRLAD